MIAWFGKSAADLQQELWDEDLSTLKPWQRLLYRSLRILSVLVRELVDGQLTLRAMSLVYTTLLSIVPLLAVSFSVLKGFGVHNKVEPVLHNLVAPLGPKGIEVADKILLFVENMKVGVLGAVGLAMLFYTVIALIYKIEKAFNSMWHTKTRRSFVRRFSDYLSVIMIGPVLVFSALGITASIMNSSVVQAIIAIEPFGTLMLLAGKLVPYLFVIAAFSFIYVFVPNTKVKLSAALVGGLVGGILWQTTGMLFASFAAGSTSYAAIYSGFAILVLFMIWLYVSWLILLFGAKVAYLYQYPENIRQEKGTVRLSNRLKERISLMIMVLVAESYYHEGEPWNSERLAERTGLPGEIIAEMLDMLIQQKLLIETGDDPPGYVPLHDPATIPLEQLLTTVRRAEEVKWQVDVKALGMPAVDRVMNELDKAGHSALNGRSIRSLVTED